MDLVSRIVIPALGAFVITAALLPVFRLSALSAAGIVLLALTGTLQGIIIALLIYMMMSVLVAGIWIFVLLYLMDSTRCRISSRDAALRA